VDVSAGSRTDVIPAAAPRILWKGPRGGEARLLVGSTGPDMLELWEWEMRPGERYEGSPHPAGTQELVHVTHGRLSLAVAAVSYVIGTGRSAIAFTDQAHAYACVGGRPVRFTMAVAEWHSQRASSRQPRRRRRRS
jgi:Cupin domain